MHSPTQRQLDKDTDKSGGESKVKGRDREMKEEFRLGGAERNNR